MLGIYIHIPFCVRKCRYCGFFSTTYDAVSAEAFVSALGREMELHAPLLQSRPIGSLYIGGGTPTVLSSAQLSRIFDGIDELCAGSLPDEITIEANPGTLTPEKLSLFLRRGVTRLSIGVQSFDNDVLASLGRLHSASEAVSAYRAARAAGFRNIGFDLMYGIPGQTGQQWLDTLATAVSLKPEHLSAYGLSLDEGSQLSREAAAGTATLPDDEAAASQYAAAVEILGRNGYDQYEISNFSVPGHACRHNNNYWDRGEYLGLGPGAWSFIGNKRRVNIPDVSEYLSRVSAGTSLVGSEEVLDLEQEAAETLFLGLRTTSGVDLWRYAALAGRESADALRRRLNELEGTGLFRVDGTKVRLTTRGMLLSNEAISRLLP